MTRVEKYREYRKEILNSFYADDEITKKKIASKRVSNATLNTDTGNSLSYQEVLEAYDELYDEKKDEPVKKTMSKAQKKQLLFVIIGILIVIALLVALIIIGINIFGGK